MVARNRDFNTTAGTALKSDPWIWADNGARTRNPDLGKVVHYQIVLCLHRWVGWGCPHLTLLSCYRHLTHSYIPMKGKLPIISGCFCRIRFFLFFLFIQYVKDPVLKVVILATFIYNGERSIINNLNHFFLIFFGPLYILGFSGIKKSHPRVRMTSSKLVIRPP